MAPTTPGDTCAQCDGATEMYDASELGTAFIEWYECVECGAHGTIRGDTNETTDK